MMQTAIVLAPLAAVAWYSSQGTKSNVQNTKKTNADQSWISDNVWVYLEDPVSAPRTIPGDYMEYDIAQPWGPVQQSMSEQSSPVAALAILGNHESRKDKLVSNLWTEFVKPRREIATRSVNLPVTQISFLSDGSQLTDAQGGSRFYDAPVPRWTGTDRYYKRKVTVPYYVVP